jgi:hypothetical protein
VLAIGVVLVLAFWFSTIAVWVGEFLLTLDVRSESGKAIKALSYTTFFHREQAPWLLTKRTEGEPDVEFRPAVQNDGKFVVNVTCSGRLWIFDIETKYTEPRYIVVRVTYMDGKESRQVAEIPAGRGPRSMTIIVP